MLYVFVASAIVLVCAIIFFLFFPIAKKVSWKRNFVEKFGRKIYSLANKEDFYLINTLVFKGSDENKIQIDHLLISEKYFFVIKDYYFDGKIDGKINDSNWIYYYGNPKRPLKTFVDNPFIINRKRIVQLSLATNIDQNMMVSLILINDDCTVSGIETNNTNEFLIKRKDLSKFITSMDSNKKIRPLDQEELAYTVHDLARMNLKPR